MGIKTRFAPSPTGYLHLGNVWVAFLNWLWTRQNKGRIILRIEDIDQSRCRADYISAIKEDLSWLGLDWDEEPGHVYAMESLYKVNGSLYMRVLRSGGKLKIPYTLAFVRGQEYIIYRQLLI